MAGLVTLLADAVLQPVHLAAALGFLVAHVIFLGS